MSLFYKQNAAARFFVDLTNGKVYEVVGGSAALLCWRNGMKERGPSRGLAFDFGPIDVVSFNKNGKRH